MPYVRVPRHAAKQLIEFRRVKEADQVSYIPLAKWDEPWGLRVLGGRYTLLLVVQNSP